jgi:putative hydrolase of the HAD superfamily
MFTLKIKVIVFDLDDTLYDEITFVKSGFNEVANFFSLKYGVNKSLFLNKMLEILEIQGRGQVFDETLKFFNIFNKTNIKKSISIYRLHQPKISLKPEAKEVLDFFISKNIPLYLVTDGNKIVQKNKVASLEIKKYFQKIFITHRYGIKYSKPSPYCFTKISYLEGVDNKDIVYIGDNINKDFVGIKPLGFKTIRILNGMFKNDSRPFEYEAEYVIDNLKCLQEIIRI